MYVNNNITILNLFFHAMQYPSILFEKNQFYNQQGINFVHVHYYVKYLIMQEIEGDKVNYSYY